MSASHSFPPSSNIPSQLSALPAREEDETLESPITHRRTAQFVDDFEAGVSDHTESPAGTNGRESSKVVAVVLMKSVE